MDTLVINALSRIFSYNKTVLRSRERLAINAIVAIAVIQDTIRGFTTLPRVQLIVLFVTNFRKYNDRGQEPAHLEEEKYKPVKYNPNGTLRTRSKI